MITFKEALHGHDVNSVPKPIQNNLSDLLAKVNVIRSAWGKPMTVTSGYRTAEEQKKINPKATKSNHLTGHAIDIADDGLILTKWLKGDGAMWLEAAGLYCEEGNSNWVHFSDIPPKSGKRWFLP